MSRKNFSVLLKLMPQAPNVYITSRFEIARNDGDNSRVNPADSCYRVYRGRDGKIRGG